MLLGARFVCPKCRLRGAARACPRCGRVRLDLADEPARAQLRSAWTMFDAWQRGLSLLSPRAIRMHRRLLALALVLGVGGGLGAPVVAALFDPRGPPLAVALLGGVVMAPVVALVLAVFFFYYAHVLRLLALIAGALLSVVPLGRGRLRLAGGIFHWIAQLLVPVVEPDPEPVHVDRAATLASPLVVRRVSDGLAWLQCADAWADDFEIELDGRRVRVEPAYGAIGFAMSYYNDLAARGPDARGAPGPYRGGGPDAGDAGSVPPWLASPGRAQRVRRSDVPAGRAVRVAGGVMDGGALVGTPDSPLAIEIG